jgi:hypothetical protein
VSGRSVRDVAASDAARFRVLAVTDTTRAEHWMERARHAEAFLASQIGGSTVRPVRPETSGTARTVPADLSPDEALRGLLAAAARKGTMLPRVLAGVLLPRWGGDGNALMEAWLEYRRAAADLAALHEGRKIVWERFSPGECGGHDHGVEMLAADAAEALNVLLRGTGRPGDAR